MSADACLIPYRIRTPRLTLRCYQPTDAAARLEASRGSHLGDFFPPQPEGTDLLEFHLSRIRAYRGKFDLDQDWMYVAEDPTSGAFLGEVCLLTRAGIAAREIGYWLAAAGLKQGFATEMAGAMARIAFELHKVRRVDLMISPRNSASAAIARRLGFTLEGTLRDRQLASHHPRGDLFSFSLLQSEYPTSPARALAIQAYDSLDRRLL